MDERYKEIEKSIIKKFRKEIWSKFVKAVIDYKLIEENDKVMVCISGGKDSMLMAKCVEEMTRHGKVHFEAKYVCMNPGYSDANRELILENAKTLNIDLQMFESNIFDVVFDSDGKSPCYLCARMRRGHLYAKAKELGCNKIALGHHFDDVIETTLLSMFYGSEMKTMMPKLHSTNFEGLELIRPMYLVHEENVVSWAKYNKLSFINCACRFTENCSLNDDDTTSKRREMKKLIKKMIEANPNADINVFRSMENVNLDCVLGYTKDGEKHDFLDEYEDK
jgi:tRNA(Ile)-lysidine synthase TilS/MesJ